MWFKFRAETENIVVDVKTGTVYGTMRRQQVALWNDEGAEVSCARWTANAGTVTLTADTLTPGAWYYISVDDDNTSGTFSLCLQGNPLDADIAGSNVSCFGMSDGSVTVTPQGGTLTGYTRTAWTKDGTPIAVNTASAARSGPGVCMKCDNNGHRRWFFDSSDPYTVTEDPASSLASVETMNRVPGLPMVP